MSIPLRLLVVGDSPPDAGVIVDELTRAGFEPDWARVETEGEFLAALGPSIDLVLAEHARPRYDGLGALRAMRERGLDIPLIILSGDDDEEAAVAAINEGAADYLGKGRLTRLGLAVSQALEHRDLHRKAREAEAALRESERRLSESQRLARIGSWSIELPGWHVTWFDETYRVYGVSPDKFVPSMESLLDMVHPEDRAAMEEWIRACLEDEKPSDLEVRSIRPDGSIRTINGRGELVLDEANRPVRLIGTAQDITEQKRTEDALRESEELYRSLFDNMLNGFAYCRMLFADGKPQDFIYLAVNDAFESQTGLKDVVGKKVSEVIPGIREADPQLFEIYGRVAMTGQPEHFEMFVEALQMWFSIAVYSPAHEYFVAVFDVVSERHRTEDALRESEARYRLLVDESPSAIVVHQDGILVFVNQAALLMMGAEGADELIGRPISAIVHPAQWEAVRERIGRMLHGETGLYPVDERFVRLDGSEVQVEVTSAPFTFGGRPAIQVIALDITERALARERLRESEERFRATFEQAAVGIVHVAPDGRWLRVNQKLCEILGYTREELLQKSFREITYPGDVESGVEAQRRLLAGEIRTYSEEKRYLRKDGSTVWVNLTVSLVRTASGEADYFLSITEDISRRKQAEAMLELESAALSAAADAILITDAAGTIEWVNPAFTALTGYGAEEAAGKNPRELLKSGVHDQAFYKDLWDTILAGNVWEGELTNRRKDGSLWDEEQTITPVKGAGGAISHFIAIKRDVTERKRLEAQFLQSQKMESVGQLAGGIAHDFNNLLNVINGTAFLVSEQLKAGDPLREDLREITQAADRAAAMTRQLLAFSRKQIMQPKVLDLGTLVLDLEGMLRRLIGEDIELVVVPAKGPCSVRADPGQIEQVIMNLAVNARDAMPTGGTLAIATEAVALRDARAAAFRPSEPGPYVVLTVSDTGVGMDEATRARIFEPFFTTKEVGKGTGLGLSTVFGIVSQSGGGIEVVSEPGKGTAFKVYLSRVDEAAASDQPASPVVPQRGAETILVVEDYLGLRVLAKRFLQSAGYTVLDASSGEQALLLLKGHDGPVHLLLTDVVMPGMNGRELAARVVEAHPETRVLYTSGHTDDAIMRHGIRADAVHFLGKPYTQADLTRAVRVVLDAG